MIGGGLPCLKSQYQKEPQYIREGEVFKPILRIFLLFVLSILVPIQSSTRFEQENRIPPMSTQIGNQEASRNPDLSPDFAKIPLYFVPNRGQVDETALFYAKTSRYTLWLTKEGLVFDSTRRMKKENAEPKRLSPRDMNDPEDFLYERDVSRLVFLKANRSPVVIPVDATDHEVNYFIGNDESKWRTNVQTSRAVLYKELYPNIDLRVYGMEEQIEYDFVVKPGGEVSDIGLEYKDVETTRIDSEGNLIVNTEFGEIIHAKPVCYQVIGGAGIEIQAEFMKTQDNNYGFKVEGYDRNYELIIDPTVLVYSTYLGGSGWDMGYGIAVGPEGAIYVTGRTYSFDFPIQNPIQGSHAEVDDVFIVKVNASGSALIYSTYLGGSGSDFSQGMAVDSEGAAYVTGHTDSIDFPTKDAIQGGYGGEGDAFISKINASGTALVYSTYLGGSGSDGGSSITVDPEGAVYVAGSTSSFDFPTQNPIQETKAGQDDAFITKVNASGSALIYSTYLGGSSADYGNGVAVGSEGVAYVTGDTKSADFPTQNPIQGSHGNADDPIIVSHPDVFITKVNASGSAMVYSTYLGGSGEDVGRSIAVDSEDAACVTGYTSSIDFPTQSPIQETNAGQYDAFITKISASGSVVIYSTYLGGSYWDIGFGMAVDFEGAAYVTGYTNSIEFPTRSPIQQNCAGGTDIFIANVNSSGSIHVYSTYLGGSGDDNGYGIAVDSEGAAYVTGNTYSVDFPTQNPIYGTYAGELDAFIVKLLFTGPVPTYSLTITAGSGGTTDPSPGTYTHDEGTEVTIRAIPNSGYTFSGWSGGASGTTNPISIGMDSDKSITASFTKISSDDDGGGGGGGCFIATVCYGSSMAEEVRILSAFRDRYLMTNPIGEDLVKFYETHSPRVADLISDREDLKIIIRACLKAVVRIINEFF